MDAIWEAVRAGALERLGKAAADAESLYDFIPRVSPGFAAPHHLEAIVRELDQAAQCGGVEVCTSTPPRHTKTSTIIHWIVRTAARRPGVMIGYATYNQTQARKVSRKARAIAERAGLRFVVDTLDQWVLENGSVITWGGVGASWTGNGFHIIVCDDLIKGRKEAESPLIRETAWEWFAGTLYTRQEPGQEHVSLIVNGTRWHPDDPIGRLIAQGWRFVNLQALSPTGVALWPEGFSAERLLKIRERSGEYEFSALYQGEPRQKGATVFGEPKYYEALPANGYSTSGGMDFAYTVRTWSDFSVLVVLRVCAGVAYVVDVLRERLETPQFKHRALPVLHRHGLSRDPRRPGVQAYIGGTEKGILDLLKAPDGSAPLYVTPLNANSIGDKFARAQPVAAAWNAAKVQVPANVSALASLGSPYREMSARDPQAAVPWLQPFLDEVCNFTGVSDPHDDQVDALAGAFAPFTVAPTARNLRNLPPG